MGESMDRPSNAESSRRKLEQAVGVGEGASDAVILDGFNHQDTDGQEELLGKYPELKAIVDEAEH